ncbi:MAG: hypothetical protein ABIK44_07300 [candidate division WOR-3 bacterium]
MAIRVREATTGMEIEMAVESMTETFLLVATLAVSHATSISDWSGVWFISPKRGLEVIMVRLEETIPQTALGQLPGLPRGLTPGRVQKWWRVAGSP